MIDIIVEIMAEVLSILGIVTKEIGERRTSMSFTVDNSSEIDLRSREIFQEAIWIDRGASGGRRTEPGQIDARGGSYGGSRTPEDHSRN